MCMTARGQAGTMRREYTNGADSELFLLPHVGFLGHDYTNNVGQLNRPANVSVRHFTIEIFVVCVEWMSAMSFRCCLPGLHVPDDERAYSKNRHNRHQTLVCVKAGNLAAI